GVGESLEVQPFAEVEYCIAPATREYGEANGNDSDKYIFIYGQIERERGQN
ncbi:hypothetical protein Tco_0755890, partial [Tanacetum coccineum]